MSEILNRDYLAWEQKKIDLIEDIQLKIEAYLVERFQRPGDRRSHCKEVIRTLDARLRYALEQGHEGKPSA